MIDINLVGGVRRRILTHNNGTAAAIVEPTQSYRPLGYAHPAASCTRKGLFAPAERDVLLRSYFCRSRRSSMLGRLRDFLLLRRRAPSGARRNWQSGSQFDLIRNIARDWQSGPQFELIREIKPRSMLHESTLTLLGYFASYASSAIIEVGPYTGGATVVMARALKSAGRTIPFVTVERGGSHLSHPQIPSSDILSDLKDTLRAFDVADRVAIVHGESNAPGTLQQVKQRLGGSKADLIVFDSDGQMDRDFRLYGELLAPGAVIVCDDYQSDYALEKASLVKPWVDQMVAAGTLRDLGVYPWGTWFGQLRT